MDTRKTGIRLALLGAALTMVLGTRGSVLAAPEAAKKTCCFNNPQYAGTCQVQPGEGETCAGILGYLNNPSSTGKSYCNSTEIRGGWTEVTCKPSKKQAPGS
jgi:hypothetical protein